MQMSEQYRDLFIEALSKHNNHSKWDNALFGQIKIISNTKVGSVGQDFIILLCDKLRIPYELPKTKTGQNATQSPWDIKIMDITFELKQQRKILTTISNLTILGIIENIKHYCVLGFPLILYVLEHGQKQMLQQAKQETWLAWKRTQMRPIS